MLVDNFGDVVISNDGATILKEIDVQHPVAKFVIELSKTQDNEVGDGTTTVVILAGELLKKAEELLEEDIHPTVIVEGYRRATEKAIDELNKIAITVKEDDDETLKKIAKTAMGSKIVAASSDYLSDIVVKAIRAVAEGNQVDIDDIKVEKKEGLALTNTELINGVVLDKEVVHPGMPKKVEQAKVALVSAPIEVQKGEFSAELSIEDPTKIQQFLDREQNIIKEKVDKILETGANVLITQKGIEDIAQHFLAKAGVLTVRRVKKSDMEKLAKATGAKIATNLDDLSADDLGQAGIVEERKIGDDDMVFVEDCPAAKSVTILVRGGTELVVDEVERSLHDALCVVRNVVNINKIVIGGGAPEVALSRELTKFGDTLAGREQLAVYAFAEALEVIPRTLAENAGLDPIDIMVELRSSYEKGQKTAGVDPIGGKVRDIKELDVLEPLVVKSQAITAASEAAQMILRIDDVIASKGEGGGPPPGGPGAGDMGDDFD
jgi:thermosome